MVSHENYAKLDGMSNNFWGWGAEDDEFREQIRKKKIKVTHPENIHTGRNQTFFLIHAPHRSRDKKKCFHQEDQSITYRKLSDGANATKYNIVSVTDLEIDSTTLTVLNVELKCNKTITPWCKCSEVKNKH